MGSQGQEVDSDEDLLLGDIFDDFDLEKDIYRAYNSLDILEKRVKFLEDEKSSENIRIIESELNSLDSKLHSLFTEEQINSLDLKQKISFLKNTLNIGSTGWLHPDDEKMKFEGSIVDHLEVLKKSQED